MGFVVVSAVGIVIFFILTSSCDEQQKENGILLNHGLESLMLLTMTIVTIWVIMS